MSDLKREFMTGRFGPANYDRSGSVQRVGVVEGVLGGPERFASVAALFPQVTFETLGSAWPERWDSTFDVQIVPVSGTSAAEVEDALRRLKTRPPTVQVLVVLRDAEVTTTRRLVREGAADVLPAPVNEAALALSLERLFLSEAGEPGAPGGPGAPGEIVALIKAGGGVGATSLGVQLSAMLSARNAGQVCLADLDIQFGAAALYFDLPEAVTVADLLSVRTPLSEAPFASALATHRSGARLLAAPRDVMALETFNPAQSDALLKGLSRAFPLTLVDLPPVWTAWTNQVLTVANRIILVTQLTVPHIQLVKRQLRVLASQRLDERPLTLVCNAVSKEQQASVSIKAAERALNRPFDVVIPEDRRLMTAAMNQGLEISAVTRGSKVEKAIAELAEMVAPPVLAATAAPKRGWR